MAAPPESSQAARSISDALSGFLRRGKVSRVYFAEGATPPPPLAYLVHFPRISLTLKGADPMLIEQSGRAQRIRPVRGEVVVVPANCWNRPTWKEGFVTLSILLGRNQVGLSLVAHDGRSTEPGPAVKVSVPRVYEGPLKDIMRAIVGLGPQAREALPHLVQALFLACLDSLQRSSSPRAAGRAAAAYDTLCMYVQERFQFPLSRDSVAEHFRVSPTHVSRLFKQHGEVGFSDYLTYVRIDRAKYLLKSYGQTVGEVAAACGFSDSAYFCRVFKQVTKLTPSDYRTRIAGSWTAPGR